MARTKSRVRVVRARGRRELRVDGSFASSFTPGEVATGGVWDALAAGLLALSAEGARRERMLPPRGNATRGEDASQERATVWPAREMCVERNQGRAATVPANELSAARRQGRTATLCAHGLSAKKMRGQTAALSAHEMSAERREGRAEMLPVHDLSAKKMRGQTAALFAHEMSAERREGRVEMLPARDLSAKKGRGQAAALPAHELRAGRGRAAARPAGASRDESVRRRVARVAAVALPAPRLLLLGLGAGSVARLLRALAPDALLVGVERDARVLAHARESFGLDALGLEVVRGDAVQFLARTRRRFDAIFEDCFVGEEARLRKPAGIPAPAFAHAAARLAPGGVLVSNTLDETAEVARVLGAHFRRVVCIALAGYDNRVLVAGGATLDARVLRARVAATKHFARVLPLLSFRALARNRTGANARSGHAAAAARPEKT